MTDTKGKYNKQSDRFHHFRQTVKGILNRVKEVHPSFTLQQIPKLVKIELF